MSTTIQFNNVSKFYRLNFGQSSLRETLSNLPRRMLKHNVLPEENGHWALRNISFDLEQGRVLGIIGPNGAGKTTTLKMLCGVTKPTEGKYQIKGRVSALIELGAGFHPELSGRENVYLNGAILGLKRTEIDEKYNSIVEFAELEKFMDTPVKRYSSGMYARLGFAVAAHVDPDVLLVDEVLAVGDVNFQQKCYDFIHNYVTSGHTTVFVSHNLFALEQLCDQILWLDQGSLRMIGPAQSVLSAYMQEQDEKLSQIGAIENTENSNLQIDRVFLADPSGVETKEFQVGDDIYVHVDYTARKPLSKPHFVLAVWDSATRQPVFLASMLADNQAPEQISGQGKLICRFKSPPLMPRAYQVWGEVWSGDRKNLVISWQPFSAFAIIDKNPKVLAGGSLRHERLDAPVKVPYLWILNGSEINGRSKEILTQA